VRLLVVEDSNRLRASLMDGLTASGYAVDGAADGREGLASARAIDYDAIVLDIMMPELDGISMLQMLRASGRTTPVIILTARDRVEQRIEGLRAGADDYLVKPFSFDELVARIEALCRRSHGHAANAVEIDGVRLDLAARQFTFEGREVDFTPREFAILELLFVNRGRVLSRAEIEEHVYDAENQVWSNSIDRAVAGIRRRLGAIGRRQLVKTRRGLGYLVAPSAAESEKP
jgi:DNA-binding response OmpR family regulator